MRRWHSPLARAVVAVAATERFLPGRLRTAYALRRQQDYERRSTVELARHADHLQHAEARRYSQNGEDGILAEILRRIGTGDRFFVEIGASDGHENCTRALLEDGWRGVWVEGDAERAAEARRVIGDRPVTVVHALLEPDAATAVLDEAGVPADPDVLVVDIDGNDAWMWQAVGAARRARVVIVEVNARVGPRLRWTLPYRPGRAWDETARHGASLAALAALGRGLGYTLVGCDSRGVNAFFVRADLAAPFRTVTVREAWVPPRFALPYGHPWRPVPPFDPGPGGAVDGGTLELRVGRVTPGRRLAGRPVFFGVSVTNRGDRPVGESTTNPVRVAAWWEDGTGRRLSDDEPWRSIQPWSARPGATAHLVGAVPAPPPAPTAVLVVGLVVEGDRWLTDTPGCVVRVPGWSSVAAPSAGRPPDRAPDDDLAGLA